MARRRGALGLSAAGVCVWLLATGCGIGDDTPTISSQPQLTSSSPASSPPAPQEQDDDLQMLGPLGDLNAADLASGYERAVAFLRALAATNQDSSAWWAGIQPLLSPSAAEDYSYVDPAEVPTFEVQPSSVRELPGGSSALVQVQVATSRGDYVVTLTRTSSTDPWLVSRCEATDDPPGDAQ